MGGREERQTDREERQREKREEEEEERDGETERQTVRTQTRKRGGSGRSKVNVLFFFSANLSFLPCSQ